ncbi:CtsR family transcriptional regulator [Alkaliphilus hydrothermalis]|uniref:Transcriptional regulator CtsR n=1 Tax=Alkaliphilus hydrothermalis TaxID=1482730 RepID=A0ABS2NQW0_9FIRM|nr:transcriptional regulator CtsR [Alkaliphilus hydrothermalis]
MTTISDIIEVFLKDLIRKSNEKRIEIQRNDLAKHFDCSPSQINYVLTTRFTLKNGYTIESQRGGGGYIRIKQLILGHNPSVFHIITEEMGDSISQTQGLNIIQFLLEQRIITKREAKIMGAAIDDTSLNSSSEGRNQMRAKLLKNMLSILLEEA